MSLSSTTSSRFLCGDDVGLDAVERVLEVLGRRRLDQVRERAVREAVLPLLLDREHLHRDVPRRRIELQVVQHRPAEHVGQEDVERDRGRQVLARERQRRLAAVGDDALEALVAREAEQHARVVRIVVDDEQRRGRPRGCRRGRRRRPPRPSRWPAPAARPASAIAVRRRAGRHRRSRAPDRCR